MAATGTSKATKSNRGKVTTKKKRASRSKATKFRNKAAQGKHRNDADSPVWERDNPKSEEHQPLSAKAKATAKRRAKKAGRPYPNLVDNIHAAREEKQ